MKDKPERNPGYRGNGRQKNGIRNKEETGVIRTASLNMIVVGMTTIMLGTLLPAMRADYGFVYAFGGTLISAASVGTVAMNLLSGFLTMRVGQKRSFTMLIGVGILGFVLMLLTRSPAVLLIACLLTGASKGAGSTYSSGIINRLARGDAGLMNAVHACFAVGACLAPLILLISVQGALGWQGAVLILAALGVIPLVSGMRMKLREEGQETDKKAGSWGFFRERDFWISEGILFCYMTVETAVIGWIVTYFSDTGVAAEGYAQVLNIICWAAVLAGRILIAFLAKKIKTAQLLLALSVFACAAYVLMLSVHSLGSMFLVMILLGLGFSGAFGCCISNAGEVFNRYPVSLGVFTTMASVGSIFVPVWMGAVADRTGITAAMRLLIVFFAGQVVFSAVNAAVKRSRSGTDAGTR